MRGKTGLLMAATLAWLAGCEDASPAPTVAVAHFALADPGTNVPSMGEASPIPPSPGPGVMPGSPGFPADTPSPQPSDSADPAPSPDVAASPDTAATLARATLQVRIDTLLQLGLPIDDDWLPAVDAEASALRGAIATLSRNDAAVLAASPFHPPGNLASLLMPAGSNAAKAFHLAGDALAADIRAHVAAGAPRPSGAGVEALVFGGGYVAPVTFPSSPPSTPTPQPVPSTSLNPLDPGFLDSAGLSAGDLVPGATDAAGVSGP